MGDNMQASPLGWAGRSSPRGRGLQEVRLGSVHRKKAPEAEKVWC